MVAGTGGSGNSLTLKSIDEVMEYSQKYRFLFASALFTGNEAFFQNLRDGMCERGDVEVSLLPIELEPKELLARIPLMSRNFSVKNAMVTRSRIRSLERSGKVFDAAFINHITPAYLLGSFMERVPTIITLDVTPPLLDAYSSWYETSPPLSPRNPIERLKHTLARGVYRQAELLMPWSSWAKESLIKDYGISEEKIVVLPPGINLKVWNGQEGRRSISNGHGPLKVLFVGGAFLRKGGDLLLKVAQRPEFQDWQFHFVTKTYQGPQPKNVFLYPNISPNTDSLRMLYQEADIFAMPTRADFSPLAVCEAMAMGLPVISTEVGALREAIEDGETGLVVPLNDEAAVADRLKRLGDDPDLRRRIGMNARMKVEDKFNLEKNVDIIFDYLKRAAGRHMQHKSQRS